MVPILRRLRCVCSWSGILILAIAGGSGDARAASCTLKELTTLPLLDDADPVVSVEMNGRPRRVLIDTGGFWSFMNPAAAGDLKPFTTPVEGRLGLDGLTVKQAVKVPTMTLGAVAFKNVDFLMLPPDYSGIDATLGANWLNAFDLEIDPAMKTASLFSNEHCAGAVVHWLNSGVTTLPFNITHGGNIVLSVRLDGQELPAVFDTGTSRTVLDMATAARLYNLTADSPDVRSNADKTVFLYRFKTLDLGGIVLKDSVIEIAPINNGGHKLILGMSDIGQIHFYLARGERKIYATDPVSERRTAAIIKAYQSSLSNPNPGLVDYLNRASQAAFNKDFGAASAALDAAMRIDPNSTYVYGTRAEVAALKKDYASALRDADTAVRLGPDNRNAYRQRAEVYAAIGYPDRAIQDLTTAIALKSDNGLFYQTRSQLYEDTGDFARAAADMDVLLRLSPNNPWAIGRRCKLEALIGRLDSARDICAAGLKMAPTDDAILDAQGYIELHAGRYDDAIEAFSDALKSFPTLATALYGRGLAERQLGHTRKGDADIAAAQAKVPDIAQRFDR